MWGCLHWESCDGGGVFTSPPREFEAIVVLSLFLSARAARRLHTFSSCSSASSFILLRKAAFCSSYRVLSCGVLSVAGGSDFDDRSDAAFVARLGNRNEFSRASPGEGKNVLYRVPGTLVD